MPSQSNHPVTVRKWLTHAIQIGLIGGIIAVSIGVQGMVLAFNARFIIGGVIALGHLMILLTMFVTALIVAGRNADFGRSRAVAAGTLSGLVVSVLLVLFIAIGTHVDLSSVLLNAVPALYTALVFGQGPVAGSVLLLALGIVIGWVASAIALLPPRLRRAIILPMIWIISLGTLQDLITTTLSNFKILTPLLGFVYTRNGLSILSAIVLFLLIAVVDYAWPAARTRIQNRVSSLPSGARATLQPLYLTVIILFLLALPSLVGLYLSQVLDDVGIYILMGLGLNIVVGFAGLLDLGYVAFFAIGAYTVGVLTTPDFGHPAFLTSWWLAVPVAIAAAMLAGTLLGIPVLKMRGDYLAIVTLGFGEIIRLLAISDFLKPYIGGAQGILDIAKPAVLWIQNTRPQVTVGPVQLLHPEQFYYVVLGGCLLVAFISTRVKNSRIGRAWMAIREDEDAAEAMGVNLVSAKLLAFGMGASFGGLSGAIFGSQLGSIFPQSFNFIVSVNVLALIIIGGMGNIPGVVIGGLVLVGLPELLREFSDYRFLFYGAVLVLMMLLRPEGLLPEARHKEELEESRQEAAAEQVLVDAPGK